MQRRTLAASLLLLLLSALSSSAQTTPTPTQTPTPAPARPAQSPTPAPAAPANDAKKKYDALLEKAKRGEGAIDFKELRFAFFETPEYSPLTGMLDYRSVWGALMQGNFAEAAKAAEAVLAKNYVDANAHMVAHIAHRELGDAQKAQLHRKWADGLIESIKSTGDGKTPATAFEVISISEEYAVLRAMQVNRKGQSLIKADGHSYDALKVVDPRTQAEATYYFNVDKPFSAYGRK